MWLWYSLLLNFYFCILVPYFVKPGNELCTSTEIIDTLEECKVAISSLERTFMGKKSQESYPKGCYAFGLHIGYWNTPSTGRKSRWAHPICKKKGEKIK